jgi:hypothetical protein
VNPCSEKILLPFDLEIFSPCRFLLIVLFCNQTLEKLEMKEFFPSPNDMMRINHIIHGKAFVESQ